VPRKEFPLDTSSDRVGSETRQGKAALEAFFGIEASPRAYDAVVYIASLFEGPGQFPYVIVESERGRACQQVFLVSGGNQVVHMPGTTEWAHGRHERRCSGAEEDDADLTRWTPRPWGLFAVGEHYVVAFFDDERMSLFHISSRKMTPPFCQRAD
jgi:hypothetical protein